MFFVGGFLAEFGLHLWPEQGCGQLAPSRLRAKRTNLFGLLCRDVDRAIVTRICLTMQQKFDSYDYGWWSTRARNFFAAASLLQLLQRIAAILLQLQRSLYTKPQKMA